MNTAAAAAAAVPITYPKLKSLSVCSHKGYGKLPQLTYTTNAALGCGGKGGKSAEAQPLVVIAGEGSTHLRFFGPFWRKSSMDTTKRYDLMLLRREGCK